MSDAHQETSSEEILRRIEELEKEVKGLREDTKDVISAFQAAQGAFMFFEWLARAIKPILFIGATVGGAILWLKGAK